MYISNKYQISNEYKIMFVTWNNSDWFIITEGFIYFGQQNKPSSYIKRSYGSFSSL